MVSASVSRRQFLALSFVALPNLRSPHTLLHQCEHAHAHAGRKPHHPTPRPGIDASRVLKAGDLKDAQEAIVAFDEVRQIPQIVDGIRCQCGCADLEGNYSLLSCYEGSEAMAKWCERCQGQGRYVFRLHRAGKSLDEIRAAIDARYG